MIDRARRAEIAKIKGSSFLKAINNSLFYVSAKIIIFVILSIWVLGNKKFLDAKMVFLTISLMNHVRVAVCQMLPSSVSFSSEALISMKRITTYLCLPDTQESSKLNRRDFLAKDVDAELNIENLTASYGDTSTRPTNGIAEGTGKTDKKNRNVIDGAKVDQDVLTNINLNCKRGELIVIVGPVGKCQLEN